MDFEDFWKSFLKPSIEMSRILARKFFRGEKSGKHDAIC